MAISALSKRFAQVTGRPLPASVRRGSLGLAAALAWSLAVPRGIAAPLIATSPPSSSRQGGTSVLTSKSVRTGPFRVGNRTPHPIRLVILLRSSSRLTNPETAHWDFAPGEGGSQGLLLSLGEEPLQIGPGDVVVAFTLDGTRRYWGPNVVGESLAPFWDEASGSWSMILQP